MYKSTRNGTVKTMEAVFKGMRDGSSITRFSKSLNLMLRKSFPWMDDWGRREVLDAATAVFRASLLRLADQEKSYQRVAVLFDGVMKAFNRAYRRTWVRTKRTGVTSLLKLERGKDHPCVFYLVSKHQLPQKAHEPLQGKVLIDPKWRTVLEGRPEEKRVASYVRRHKTMTVYQAMRAPYYLIVRPNCRHFLIPLPTTSAITLSERGVNAIYQKRPAHVHRPITDAERRKAYRELRSTVLGLAQKILGQKNKAGV